MSETKAPHVYEAIAAVTAEMAKVGIAKGRRNKHQGYAFRGIDDVYGALSGVLSRNKLAFLPRVISSTREERRTAKGGLLIYTILQVEFDLVSAIDGSMHTIKTEGEAMDSADKSTNKAMSAAYKYAAMMAFAIPVEGEGDADAVTHNVEPKDTRSQSRRNAHDGYGMPDDVWAEIVQLIEATKSNTRNLCAHYKVDSIKALSSEQSAHLLRGLKKRLAEQVAEQEKAVTQGMGGDSDGLAEKLSDEIPF